MNDAAYPRSARNPWQIRDQPPSNDWKRYTPERIRIAAPTAATRIAIPPNVSPGRRGLRSRAQDLRQRVVQRKSPYAKTTFSYAERMQTVWR